LVSLGISNTVTIDDEVSGELVVVLLSEGLDGGLDRLNHLFLDDFLSLALHQVIAEVLTHVPVDARREADNRLGSRVAHVDTNQHRAHLVHDRRELQSVEVAAHLAVDLAQDVGRFAQVELEGVAHGDTLRRQPEVVHDLLVHGVVVLVLEQENYYLGVSERLTTAT
jgi:hypothetical protein